WSGPALAAQLGELLGAAQLGELLGAYLPASKPLWKSVVRQELKQMRKNSLAPTHNAKKQGQATTA
ncbi:hypothetical protein BHM03_00033055, partial [Ensete ventricosum]